ncbi:AAA ATPase domain-containing protein [Amycolatopsis sacchari]|uniref:AAA ATPase domain-containing protein n=1 Tax=Amycolatopsis sacchari TaxID=115433 RepID=A0A1I3WP12_9PSEU|nr:helix-turn-helix transcriptional regulator [Amycolatopsis sacchari]SFK09235.1 AAA ATPase domain-containing protein [Amycolatopsis sacchari]
MALLVGREREVELVVGLLRELPRRGHALVVTGEAGIGKSALLSVAREAAAEGDRQLLSTTGVQSEAQLPFAGLHQVLRPVFPRAAHLPPPQRDALRVAFGLAEGPAPELFLVGLATLELLSEAAARAPLVLLAEDAHWLDRPTAEVLAFVGRRAEPEPLLLLATVRDGYDSPLVETRLPELHLGRLSEASARSLLDSRYPALDSGTRARILDEADGNPLALLELPSALTPGPHPLPARLPLSARLEKAFAARVDELPPETRTLLRIASAEDEGLLSATIEAGRIVTGRALSVADLAPAVAAQLITLEESRVRFRHPLVRSAVYQAASAAERHAAHSALARVLAADPDRQVWHRAAAALGPDPDVADRLAEAGHRARRRGATVTALAAFERAAELSPDPERRGALLLQAAEGAAELGRRELVLRLVRKADALELGEQERARSMWLGDAYQDGPPGDPARVRELVATADAVADHDLALNLLMSAGLRCYWGGLDRHGAGREVLAAADRLPPAVRHDPRLAHIRACVAPVERGAAVLEELGGSADEDPRSLHLLGLAATLVGDYGGSLALLGSAAAKLRERGSLGLLAQVQMARAWTAVEVVDLAVAVPAADEAERLTAETAQPLFALGARMAKAGIAALRGQPDVTEQLTAAVERVALPASVASMLALVQYVRALSALGQSRHAEAYEYLRRVVEPGDPAHHHLVGAFSIADLAEAAVYSGHREEAVALLRELEPLGGREPSPRFGVLIRYARAITAGDDELGEALERTLDEGLAGWPFLRARLQLALGGWLRRRRRPAEARSVLRVARDTFDALGAVPWGERARRELRASGETSSQRAPDALELLTAQELQVVQMVAEGLSNREIAGRLYLSHRTVESHLYRIFPKLGVTSRVQLAGLLSARTGLG